MRKRSRLVMEWIAWELADEFENKDAGAQDDAIVRFDCSKFLLRLAMDKNYVAPRQIMTVGI